MKIHEKVRGEGHVQKRRRSGRWTTSDRYLEVKRVAGSLKQRIKAISPRARREDRRLWTAWIARGETAGRKQDFPRTVRIHRHTHI